MNELLRRLAAIHDLDNPDGPDHDYFRSFVDAANPATVVDLGCGTGILTSTLTRQGRTVIGIDPSPEMLERARTRPASRNVRWIQGTSECLRPDSADAVIMSGNVAMHILGDDWPRSLRDIAAGLRPGGRLAFETCNPLARAWLKWSHPATERTTPVGRLLEATTVDPPDSIGVVTLHCHNEFLDDRAVLDVDQQLQFRGHDEVIGDLEEAGLEVTAVWQDWRRTRFVTDSTAPLMVVEARRQG